MRSVFSFLIILLAFAVSAFAQPNFNIVPDTTSSSKITTLSPIFQGSTTQRGNYGNATQVGTLWYSTTDTTYYYYTNAGWKPFAFSPIGANAVLYATGSAVLSASTPYKTVLDSCTATDTITLYDCTKLPPGFSFRVIKYNNDSTHAIKYKSVSSQSVNGQTAVGTITTKGSTNNSGAGAGGGAEFYTDGVRWFILWNQQ